MSAVITGGTSGLGFATAKRLAQAGDKVAIFDLNAEMGEAAAAEMGGVFCHINVTSDEQVEAGFKLAQLSLLWRFQNFCSQPLSSEAWLTEAHLCPFLIPYKLQMIE